MVESDETRLIREDSCSYEQKVGQPKLKDLAGQSALGAVGSLTDADPGKDFE